MRTCYLLSLSLLILLRAHVVGQETNAQPEKFIGIGTVKHDFGYFQEAINEFNKALALNPNFAEAYITRGSSKLSLNDVEGALADINKAIGLNPKLTLAYITRGNIKSFLNDYKGAMAD